MHTIVVFIQCYHTLFTSYNIEGICTVTHECLLYAKLASLDTQVYYVYVIYVYTQLMHKDTAHTI